MTAAVVLATSSRQTMICGREYAIGLAISAAAIWLSSFSVSAQQTGEAEKTTITTDGCNIMASQYVLTTNTPAQQAALKPQFLNCLDKLRGTDFEENYGSLDDRPASLPKEPSTGKK